MAYRDPERGRAYARQYSRAWMREAAARRKAAKFCIRCGVEDLSRSNFKTCLRCRRKCQQWRVARLARSPFRCRDCDGPRSKRNASGLCARCSKRHTGARRRKHPRQMCTACGVPLCVRNQTGLCRVHNGALQLRNLRNYRQPRL